MQLGIQKITRVDSAQYLSPNEGGPWGCLVKPEMIVVSHAKPPKYTVPK